jgi:hypothetical protein
LIYLFTHITSNYQAKKSIIFPTASPTKVPTPGAIAVPINIPTSVNSV